MAAPRKSPTALRLSGSFRADRHADRDLAPDGGPPLDAASPPPGLTPRQAMRWRETIGRAPPRVLFQADTDFAVLLIRTLDVADLAAEDVALRGHIGIGSEGSEVPAASLRVMAAMNALAVKMLRETGMTPQARLKMVAPPEEDAKAEAGSPWDVFVQMPQSNVVPMKPATKTTKPRKAKP